VTARLTIRGVRLIDGIADDARANVDVTVEDGRIAAIDPASEAPLPDGTMRPVSLGE